MQDAEERRAGLAACLPRLVCQVVVLKEEYACVAVLVCPDTASSPVSRST